MLIMDKPSQSINGGTYIKIECIKLIYEILNVKMMTDLDIQSFFYMMKKSSEELGYLIEEIKEEGEEEETE